ncbi:uncharacterized protein DUF4297 [Larkinella arboricola]|uniref:Uncharacterized protein DUF4297 n=1 Tax=Larkinella arboricola TaxID=643671 RepID=A0A327WGK6_LARAB|nr:DUF4297 domain-containing protein [Larkinella arboricola]RAJ89912.1 uncharacterized protein DUF4297 [Larkinella arboricola]
MTVTDDSSPLFAPQREKKGAETFGKYGYQYHWALYRVLKEHEKLNEYAVFVELHEDVVLSNSLDKSQAKFEFSQVKTNQTPLSTADILRPKSGKSVLGKLLDTCTNKPFASSINYINLVSANGFNIDLKVEGVALEIIRVDDIHDDTIKDIEEKIKKELGCTELPSNIQFIIPDLPDKRFQDVVISQIAKLISNLFPASFCDPMNIYRSLIDDLNMKGTVLYDYNKWDELLDKKALTSVAVTKAINVSLVSKNDAAIDASFVEITSEMGMTLFQRDRFKKAFNRYKQKRIGNRSTLQLDTSKTMKALIEDQSLYCSNMNELLDVASNLLPDKIKNQFPNKDDLNAAIICEYIMSNQNE